MRVGIDARKIADFGIGTYIRGLLGGLVALGTGDEYVAFAPAGAPIPDGVEHIVVDAPHYSVRELIDARPRRRSRAARRLPRAALRRPLHARPARGHDPRPHPSPPADAQPARAAVRARDDPPRRQTRALRADRDRDGEGAAETRARREERHRHAERRRRSALTADRRPPTADYFLYVGNDKPHKNVDTLIDAFARVRGRARWSSPARRSTAFEDASASTCAASSAMTSSPRSTATRSRW